MVQLSEVDKRVIIETFDTMDGVTLIKLPWKCGFCGKLFNPTPRQKLKVCKSCRRIRNKCLNIIHNFINGKNCKNPKCSNRFVVTNNLYALAKDPWKKDYCSYDCYRLDSPDYITKECYGCNKKFPIHKKYKNSKKVFCSSLCRDEFLRHQKCEKCNRTFNARKIVHLCLNCFFDNFATKCLNCGKTLKKHRKRIITEENHNYLKSLGYGKKKLSYFKISNMQYCSIDCVIEKESPYYYKGIKDEEYPPEFNSVLKRKIIERDRSKCQLCDINYNLAVHHIDYNKQNVEPTNLITLCRHHHTKTNWNRQFWVNLFSNYQLWRGLYD